MARKSYRKRYYRKKGRWSANIKQISGSETAGSGNFFIFKTLCQNPAQNDSSVSQQYTVKNVDLSYILETQDSQKGVFENCIAYIMYVPQGMTIDYNYPYNHPEYIMAYKFIGSPQIDGAENRNPLKIKTRLSRRLQTGDGIIFLLSGYNSDSSNKSLGLGGFVRWWTKAN